ncbi:unnamed protein product [Lepeophtheirus salmonis]|uniref:(salmon louse) hypothetical protein n=1 Tax=Lepeophtheirus salmonis TaxID=72036 RepID=A0A7R8CGT4_LEPSM|nr:unnamed protein product [Lepeophtheirus salmonis]CAF2814660.1 unnamed protein product [Lepeophtheirus salmonis]
MNKVLTVIRSAMGKVKSGRYYAVARGRKVGIYNSCLAEAEKLVKEESAKEPEIGSKANNFSRSHTSDINQQNQNEFSFDETKTVSYYVVAHWREKLKKFVKEWTTKELLTGEKSNIFSSNQTPFIYYESGFSKSGAYYAIARGHEVGVFDPCREEAEKCVKKDTFNDPWIGEKSNKFRRNHIKNESGFSVDNTDWTYAKDKNIT